MPTANRKGPRTKARVRQVALELFRQQGYEGTSMRDIARAAELSVGAAYHHFASKHALLEEYFEGMQEDHERLYAEAVTPEADLGERLRLLLNTKYVMLREDRKLLTALFRELSDPSGKLSVLSEETKELRARSLRLFREPFEFTGTSPELSELLGGGLWVAHLGVFFFFLYDTSKGSTRTEALLDLVTETFRGLASWLGNPLAGLVRRRLFAAASRVGFDFAGVS